MTNDNDIINLIRRLQNHSLNSGLGNGAYPNHAVHRLVFGLIILIEDFMDEVENARKQ